MKMQFDCIPCCTRQALEAARRATDDTLLQEKIMRETLAEMSSLSFSTSPPFIAYNIHKIVSKITGNNDPYKNDKKRFNRFAMELYPRLKEKLETSPDPFTTAVRLAIAGNIIDFGVSGDIAEEKVEKILEESLKREIAVDYTEKLRTACDRADSILYLGDNAGEIVFDKFLIELLPSDKVTYAVKKEPIINDATGEDALEVGMTQLCEVIDNGAGAPGTILELCSEQFKKRFLAADLVIAKGQANYESLSSEERENIFFLLKAKCPIVARDVGCNIGDMIIYKK